MESLQESIDRQRDTIDKDTKAYMDNLNTFKKMQPKQP